MISKVSSKKVLLIDDIIQHQIDSPHLSEYNSRLKLPFANAGFKQIYFDGIAINHCKIEYASYGKLVWDRQIETITIFINLKGKINISPQSFPKPLVFNSSQHNIYYFSGTKLTISNEELYSEFLLIDFKAASFADMVRQADSGFNKLSSAAKHHSTGIFSEENLFIDISINNAAAAIISSNLTGSLKKMYLHSKCMEILVLQAEALSRTKKQEKIYCKSDYDKERILFAKDYLLSNIDSPPGIHELARISGINEFKLKHGFRELFNTSVYGYLSDTRLEIARADLQEGKKSASEIAYTLGYSSLQHFSSAFKQKFGVSPKKFR